MFTHQKKKLGTSAKQANDFLATLRYSHDVSAFTHPTGRYLLRAHCVSQAWGCEGGPVRQSPHPVSVVGMGDDGGKGENGIFHCTSLLAPWLN